MKKDLSVKFFKKVIAFTVVGIIAALTTVTVVLALKLDNLHTAIDEEMENGTVSKSGAESLDYQAQFPELYTNCKRTDEKATTRSEEKVVYLTFDDGPSEDTDKILDVLRECKVKATFFMVYKDDEESSDRIQRVIDDGHTIGIHSATHKYDQIYESVEAYLEDFAQLWNYLRKQFGYNCEIFRFPGGSINAYNLQIYDRIIPEMYRRGFTFYDWNVSSGDAAVTDVPANDIYDSVIKQVKRNDRSIILMHDSAGSDTTVEALPKIIKDLQKEGYTFRALDSSVTPITFTS